MYNPLKKVEIWSAFLIEGSFYMTQTTVKIMKGYDPEYGDVDPKGEIGDHMTTDLFRKCDRN